MTIQNIVTLKETKYEKPTGVYSVVEKCVICKGRHIHAAEEGDVAAHCLDRPHSRSYELVIDREDPENIRLAEKHGIQLGLN